MWLRRRRSEEPLATAADLHRLADRLDSIERRMEDLEDLAAAALAPDRLDDLAARVEELARRAATSEELLELRLASASVAAEVARVAAGQPGPGDGGEGDGAA